MGVEPVSGGVENRSFYLVSDLVSATFSNPPELPTGQTKEQGEDVGGNTSQAFTAPFGFLNLVSSGGSKKPFLILLIIIVAVILLRSK